MPMKTPEPLADGPAGPILLCDLARGAQLAVLVALLRARGLPMSNKALAAETGVRDDERLAEALFRLSRRNLVVNLGRPAHQNEWVATAVARQFFLPAGLDAYALEGGAACLPAPAAEPDPRADSGKTGLAGECLLAAPALPATPEIPDSSDAAAERSRVESGQSGNSGQMAPEIESVRLRGEPFNKALLSEIGQMRARAAAAEPQRLEACYQVALLRGRVYRQLVAPMARALASEGAGYLPDVLAHIAYSRSAQFQADGQLRPGAYLKRAVEGRELGDPAFMPPAGLSFERALIWALRGGEPESDEPVETQHAASPPAASPAPASRPPAPAEPASCLEAVQTPAGPRSPDETWQAARETLRRTLPTAVFEAWMRAVVLLDYAPEPDLFSLGAPHAYARDCLEKRLLDQIKSALAAVVGREVAVKVCLATVGAADSRKRPECA
jgi:hypothetical protein